MAHIYIYIYIYVDIFSSDIYNSFNFSLLQLNATQANRLHEELLTDDLERNQEFNKPSELPAVSGEVI